jgi:hypothetical protein
MSVFECLMVLSEMYTKKFMLAYSNCVNATMIVYVKKTVV